MAYPSMRGSDALGDNHYIVVVRLPRPVSTRLRVNYVVIQREQGKWRMEMQARRGVCSNGKTALPAIPPLGVIVHED